MALRPGQVEHSRKRGEQGLKLDRPGAPQPCENGIGKGLGLPPLTQPHGVLGGGFHPILQ